MSQDVGLSFGGTPIKEHHGAKFGSPPPPPLPPPPPHYGPPPTSSPAALRRFTATSAPHLHPSSYGAGGGAGGGGMGMGGPGMSMGSGGLGRPPLADPSRDFDLEQLKRSLAEMEDTISGTEMRLANPPPNVEFGPDGEPLPSNEYDMYGSFNDSGMGYPDGHHGGLDDGDFHVDEFGFVIYYSEPAIDPSRFEIQEGMLHKKGGTAGGRRNWRKRYFRVEGQQFSYWKSEKDSHSKPPEGTITVDHSIRIQKGDPEKKHHNKNVKFDFLLLNTSSDRTIELYAETRDEAEAWMNTLDYIVDCCMAATRPPPAPAGLMSPTREVDPEEKQANVDAALRHTAYGPGLYEGVRGETASLYIQSNDDSGNPLSYGGLKFEARLTNEKLHFDLEAVDQDDGTYYIEYTPTQVGEFDLEVTLKNEHIYGSPFHPIVSPAPTSAAHSLVSGDGLTSAQVGSSNEFTIVARDQWEEPRATGGDTWLVTSSGPVVVAPVIDHENGAYTISYTVDVNHPSFSAGRGLPTVEIEVALNNPGFNYPRMVKGSPFTPQIRMPLAYPTTMPGMGYGASSPGGVYGAGSPSGRFGVGGAGALTMSDLSGSGVGGAASGPFGTPSRSMYSSGVAASPSSVLSASQAEAQLELQRREQALAEEFRKLEAEKRQLAEEKSSVELQVSRLKELSKRVKADSERFAATVRATPSAAAAAASSAATPAASSHGWSGGNAVGAPQSTGAPGAQYHEPAADRAGGGHFTPQPPSAGAPRPGVAPSTAGAPIAVSSAPHAPVPPSAAPTTSAGSGPTATKPSASTTASAPVTLKSPPPPRGAVSGDPLPELFEPEVIMLFDKHKAVVYKLYEHYCSSSGALPLPQFIAIAQDFDIWPTFLNKRELRRIFVESAAAHASDRTAASGGLDADHIAMTSNLSYPAFVEALGRLALVALSKPAFQGAYSSPREKVSTLLEFWGLGVASKVQEVISNRSA